MNDRLQSQSNAYFYKDNAFGSNDFATRAADVALVTGTVSNLGQDQLGTKMATIDLDNNGTVDIIGSGGNSFQITGKTSVVTSTTAYLSSCSVCGICGR